MNIDHLPEKEIEKKSQMAERATIELINLFLNFVEVKGFDENGDRLFSLPDDQIDEQNWRTELKKPVDKFDWIAFEKIFQNVFIYAESERNRVCKLFYTNRSNNCDCLNFRWSNVFSLQRLREYDVRSDANAQRLHGNVQLFRRRMYRVDGRRNEEITRSDQETFLQLGVILEYLFLHFDVIKSMTSFLRVPCISTTLKLAENETECTISPSLEEINKQFLLLIQNIIETFYGVATWGRQAKTEARTKRKPLIGTFLHGHVGHYNFSPLFPDEVRHEKNFFKAMSEHKEVYRAMQSFNSGLLALQPLTDSFSHKMYAQYSYLWANGVEDSLKAFAESDPLIADIRDKFKHFDERTRSLQEAEHTKCIGSIMIDLNEIYDDFIEYSKQWKTILGKFLTEIYKMRMNESIHFIEDIEFTLQRPLNDLDDIGIAMKCLEKVREREIK